MIRVTVDSIRVSLLTQHRVVVLREADSRKYLPIWIGAFEADAITLAIQGHPPQRPMTHDLLKTVFGELGAAISHIVINDIHDSTFYARIIVEQAGHTIEIDARPSDAIALAVRSEVPIYVEEHVLNQAGVPLEDEENTDSEEPQTASDEPEKEPADEGLTLFRDFINTLDLEDDEGGKEKK